MSIQYYLTLFPTESLIASELMPEDFASYMATGSKKGSSERLIFAHIPEEFGDHFDWDYAHKKCIHHENGDPKHSTYLSVYNVLENIPLDKIGNLYLTTKDGSALTLKKEVFNIPEKEKRNYTLYQELCPIRPLVVSMLTPDKFAEYIISKENKITAPAIFFSDLKVIDFNDLDNTGNVGRLYDRNIAHLKSCIDMVRNNPDKVMKTLDRSYSNKFSYQVINRGIYAADKDHFYIYKMPSMKELEQKHYDWARSAQIV